MTEAPLSFTSPKREKKRTRILLDDEELWAFRPKTSVLIEIMRMFNYDDEEDPRNLAALDAFMDKCLEPDTAQRLRERMADEDDDFDIDTFTLIMEGLQAQWSDRPTTSGPGSSGPPASQRSRRRSTATVRSVASTPGG